MPNYCAVQNCTSYSKNKIDCGNVKFFSFPKDRLVRAAWVKACGKKNVNTIYERICSLHFTDDDWCLKHKLLDLPLAKRLLDPKATPSIGLPENVNNDNARAILRANRVEKRNSKKIVALCMENYEKSILQETEIDYPPVENIDEVEFGNSVHTQTEIETECSKKLRIRELEKQLRKCNREKKKLQNECVKLRTLETSVKTIFTDGQIKKLKNPNCKLNWSSDDITSAIGLHAESPRAYRYLYKKNYPLPGPSTLRQWALKMSGGEKKKSLKETETVTMIESENVNSTIVETADNSADEDVNSFTIEFNLNGIHERVVVNDKSSCR